MRPADGAPRHDRLGRLARALPLMAIILLGAFLRLRELDLQVFGDDEATGTMLALRWLEGGPFPLVGLETSIEVDRPAGQAYAVIPVLLFSRDPLLVTGYLAFLNVLSIPLCYRLVRRYFGHRPALLASLFYASSFWAAYTTRQAWDYALMPALALLLLDRLLAAAIGREPAALGWAFFWAMAAVALHPGVVALVGLVAIVALLLRVPVRLRSLAPGLAATALLWGPFAWYLLTTQGRDVQKAFGLANQAPEWHPNILGFALGQLFPYPDALLFRSPDGSIIPGNDLLAALHPLVGIFFLLSLAWCAARGLPALAHVHHPRAHYLVVALAWLAPVLLLLWHPFPSYHRYTLPLLPYAAIIQALGLLAGARALSRFLVPGSWFRAWRTRNSEPETRTHGWIWAWGGAMALAVGHVWALLSLLHWLPDHGSTLGYGPSLRFSRQALELAMEARPSVSDPIYIAAAGEAVNIYQYLAPGAVEAHLVDHRTTLAFPPADGRPIVYLTVADQSPAARFILEQFQAHETARLQRASAPDYYRVFRLPPNAGLLAQEAASQMKGPWTLANGVRIEGYALPAEVPAAAELPLTLAWTVPSATSRPAEEVQFFAHLVDRRGAVRAERDGLDYPAYRWRGGERIISWLRVPVPEDVPRGLYSLTFGMFDVQSLEPVAISEQAPPAGALVAGPVRVLPTRSPADPVRPVEPPARFGDTLELVGYDMPATGQAGRPLDLRLLWRATKSPAADYTLFAHLLDQEGRVVSQEDGFPAGGLYPTSAWRPGEIVEDQRRLPLPTSAAGQQLRVALGWYRLDSSQRLPLEGLDASQSALVLGPIAVAP